MFAELVRTNRRRLGLTQEELAAKAGLAVRTIRKIETDQVGSPRLATVWLLADAFGLTGIDRERFCHAVAGEPADRPIKPYLPAQLPADVSAFTGREEQLARLDAWLATARDQPNAVVISAVSGTAGVGKTALAVHWAHRVAGQFPDGQLYVNLRGYDPEQPVAPADALARFLSSLGVSGQDVPQELDDRAARFRTEIDGRRMLIVLDNAATVDQVRPLLPGSSSSTVVVTSRDSLSGLVAVQGAHRLELDLLPPSEALTLLRRLVGRRVDDDPEAAAALVDQCAKLPLALRVAAEQAASRPTTRLAEFVLELGNQQRRLDLLDAGDPYAAVRVVFSWSAQHLPPDVARTFRLLGLHPGPDIDVYAVAALADTDTDDSRRTLELLARAHLVCPTGHGRYSMHDLLRAYAAELARDHDTDRRRQAALGRLLDYHRHTASVAMDTAYPFERERRPRVPPAASPLPQIRDPAQATSWLDSELPNLLAAARYAAETGWPEHMWHLSSTLYRHLHTRGQYGDAGALYCRALKLARDSGHRAGVLDALISLGHVCRRQGRHDQSLDYLEQALEIAHGLGDHRAELDALRGLGQIHWLQGRYTRALDHFRRELEIARAIRHQPGETDALIGLAHVHWIQGRNEDARDYLEQALRIAQSSRNRNAETDALRGLAYVYRMQGSYEQAYEHYDRTRDLARTIGYRVGEVCGLIGLADLHRIRGQHEPAADLYQRILDIAGEIGNRNLQFEAIHGLGVIQNAIGQPESAVAYHRQALGLAGELGQRPDQARAHDGLAHAYRALNQPTQARQHWRRALDILTSLAIDYAEGGETSTSSIRAHLASFDGQETRT